VGVRELDSGSLRLDTRASISLADWYNFQAAPPVLLPGESLNVHWCMRTLFTQTDYLRSDVLVYVQTGDSGYVEFYLGPDYVSEDGGHGGYPEHFYPHYGYPTYDPPEFLFTTTDMQEYDLFVNGTLAFHGTFHNPTPSEIFSVGFGDVIIGKSSLSEWDYVDVQVVPEADGLVSMVLAGFTVALMADRRR
jgi:hypothetical protein